MSPYKFALYFKNNTTNQSIIQIMKKLLLILALPFVLLSCSSKEDEPQPVKEEAEATNPLIGKWLANDIELCHITMFGDPDCYFHEVYLEFKEDWTVTETLKGNGSDQAMYW